MTEELRPSEKTKYEKMQFVYCEALSNAIKKMQDLFNRTDYHGMQRVYDLTMVQLGELENKAISERVSDVLADRVVLNLKSSLERLKRQSEIGLEEVLA